jgi:hypothetical protein
MRIPIFWNPQFDQNIVNPSFAQTRARLVIVLRIDQSFGFFSASAYYVVPVG